MEALYATLASQQAPRAESKRVGSFLLPGHIEFFRISWSSGNVLLATAFVAMLTPAFGNIPCARYLDGFSDAIVPKRLPPNKKSQAIFELDARRAVASQPHESGSTCRNAIRR